VKPSSARGSYGSKKQINITESKPSQVENDTYSPERAMWALRELQEQARQTGVASMTLDEINAEIAASRTDNL